MPSALCAAEARLIESIDIVGLKYSDKRVVLREIPFQVGDVWKDADSDIGERRLRNLGLFSEASILPPDAEGRVHIVVNDRWPFWLLPEASRKDGGASRAGLSLNDYNLWGLHHHLRLSGSVDTGKNFTGNQGSSYQVDYFWRRISDSKYGLELNVNRGNSVYDVFQQGVLSSSYTQQVRELSLKLHYAFDAVPGDGWDGLLGFSTSQKTFQLQSGILQPDVQNRTRNAMQLGISYRLLDDHITWLTGSSFDYTFDIANRVFGSDINIVRQEVSWTDALDLDKQRTLNLRIKAGWADGNVLRDGLYDVGDGKAMRGYYTGDILGSAYIYGTIESRIPLELNSNVQWVAFMDAGHVSRAGKPALGRPLIAGLGTGVRWTLRWLINGTLRADVAYGTALKRWRVHVGTGQAF